MTEQQSQSFSIYLLKKKYNNDTSLVQRDNSVGAKKAKNKKTLKVIQLKKQNMVFYLMDSSPVAPWWKEYLGIEENIQQTFQGGILFLKVDSRWFAITFGHVAHYLKEESYEEDFGFKTTLNAIKPKVKSSDIVDLSGGKHLRIQTPLFEDITYFDFDDNENLVKSLVGKVKKGLDKNFSNITGMSAVHLTTKCSLDELPGLCRLLFKLYKKEYYKINFPIADKIELEKNRKTISGLWKKLLNDFAKKSDKISLMPPTIINYEKTANFSYGGVRGSKVYPEININHLYNLIGEQKISQEELKKIKLNLLDASSEPLKENYSIYKCLVYDIEYDKKKYCLHEGKWYIIDGDFMSRVQKFIKEYYLEDNGLPEYNHKTENDYNYDLEKLNGKCLDCENISPKGHTKIEPCDFYQVENGKAIFYHIKISTKSALLSHLFNQGYNSIVLIKQNEEAKNRLKKLLKNDENLVKPLKNNGKFKVIYGIITRKKITGETYHLLPLLSQISLYRILKNFQLMGIEANFTYIKNLTAEPEGEKKKRKNKKLGEQK